MIWRILITHPTTKWSKFKRNFPKDSPKVHQEYKLDHEYDKNGLLIKSSRNTIHPNNEIYDGTFTGNLTKGAGVTSTLLSQHGVKVLMRNSWLRRVII